MLGALTLLGSHLLFLSEQVLCSGRRDAFPLHYNNNNKVERKEGEALMRSLMVGNKNAEDIE